MLTAALCQQRLTRKPLSTTPTVCPSSPWSTHQIRDAIRDLPDPS